MNVENVYQYGNTVTLKCKFHDLEGKPINPQFVKIIFYNYRFEKINEVSVNSDPIDVGLYVYDFITENKEQKLYYEWYGELNGRPVIQRRSFRTRFI